MRPTKHTSAHGDDPSVCDRHEYLGHLERTDDAADDAKSEGPELGRSWLAHPNRETRTLSDGCNSPTVEAPMRDSILTLPALGAAGIAPKAARRFAWPAASADAAPVGFPVAPPANAAIVAACRETASPPSVCWHQANQVR